MNKFYNLILNKNYIKIFSLLSICFLLNGCGPTYRNATFKPHEFYLGNKAIIITKAYHPYKSWIFGRGEIPVAYGIARADENYANAKTRIGYRPSSKFLKPDAYDILMVDPGVYVLEAISYSDGNYDYASTSDGLSLDHKFVYGGTYVKAGEIVYAGDLDIDISSTRVYVNPIDAYEKAAHYFRSKYPEFSNEKIHKRYFSTQGCVEDYS